MSALIKAIMENNLGLAEHLIRRRIGVNERGRGGQTPLICAIIQRRSDIVGRLLAAGADVNAKDGNHKTALMYAAEKGKQDIVRLLLNAGAKGQWALRWAKENKKTKAVCVLLEKGVKKDKKTQEYLDTELLSAVHQNNIRLITDLLRAGANPEVRDKDGKSPLMYAIERGYSDIVRVMIDTGAKGNARDNNNRTALMRVVGKEEWLDAFKKLIENGADINAADEEGKTPLMIAVELGFRDRVRILLEHKANVNATDGCGKTPLMYVKRYNPDNPNGIFQQLICAGADVNYMSRYDITPLMCARINNKPEIVCALIENKAEIDPETQKWLDERLFSAVRNNDMNEVQQWLAHKAKVNAKDNGGKTVLMYATEHRKPDIATLLINAGADVNAEDGNHKTALMYAAENGTNEAILLLLEKKPDVEAKDKDGKTALMYARINNKPEIVCALIENKADIDPGTQKWLDKRLFSAIQNGNKKEVQKWLEHKANVNATDGSGKTALMYAAENETTEAIRLLLEKKPDVEAKDKNGKTALMYARINNKPEIVYALIENKADIDPETQKWIAYNGTLKKIHNNSIVDDRIRIKMSKKYELEKF